MKKIQKNHLVKYFFNKFFQLFFSFKKTIFENTSVRIECLRQTCFTESMYKVWKCQNVKRNKKLLKHVKSGLGLCCKLHPSVLRGPIDDGGFFLVLYTHITLNSCEGESEKTGSL